MRGAVFAVGALLALAGCSQAPEDRRGADNVANLEEPTAAPALVAPGIAPTAAPGVAFNYQYEFRLPNTRIAAVQERHAQACEKLGVSRCRITGMRYHLASARDVKGQLRFKLAPELARAFGRAGIQAVEQAEGILVDAAISGEDAGARIAAADRSETQVRADLARIEQNPLAGKAGAAQTEEAARLREWLRNNDAARNADAESLASTPMTFDYRSGDLVPGFDAPFRRALRQSGENIVNGTALLFLIIVTLLPWMLALAAIVLVVRWLRRRFGGSPDQVDAS